MDAISQLFRKCTSADHSVNDYVLRVIESVSFSEAHVESSPFDRLNNRHADLTRIATMQGFYIDGMECSLSQN